MFDQCPLDLSGSARSPPGSQGRQGRLHRSPPAGTCCQPLRQMVSRMRWMRSASILPSLQKRRRSLLGYARARISRAPARRSALRSWGRDTGRALQRALGRSSRIRERRGAWLLWPLAGTTAVLLPGAFYFIRERRLPPVDAFRFHGVPIALATDCNPGSSPLTSLLLAMNMGATLFRLTVDECSAGVTREAARALGIFNEIGSLESANGAISPSVISKGRGTSLSYGLQPTACARLAW
jgi:hypothetical protein